MKRTRAYTLSDDVIDILKHKPNKSNFIERAVRKYQKQESEFTLKDVPDLQLKIALHVRVCGCHKTAGCPTMALLRKL